MNKPHKHAALIKAWADGAEIEYKSDVTGQWFPCGDTFEWYVGMDYRVKPINFVRYCGIGRLPSGRIYIGPSATSVEATRNCIGEQDKLVGHLRVAIDPDTLELVSATLEKP